MAVLTWRWLHGMGVIDGRHVSPDISKQHRAWKS